MKKLFLEFILFLLLFILSSCTKNSMNDGEDHYLLQAIEYLKSHHYEKAKNECEKALEKNPANPYAYYFLGGSFYLQNDLENALYKYLRVISLDSTFLYAYLELARINSDTGKWLEAKMYIEEAQKILTDKNFIKNKKFDYRIINNDSLIEFEVYALHAEIALAVDKIREAKELSEMALILPEKNEEYRTRIHILLASIFIIENNIPEAYNTLKNSKHQNETTTQMKGIIEEAFAKRVDPLAFKYYYFGMLEKQMNETKAFEWFSKAATLSPFFSENNHNIVKFYAQQKSYEKAIELCQKITYTYPRDIRFRELLASIYEKQLKLESVENLLRDSERIRSEEKLSLVEITTWKKRINDKQRAKAKIDEFMNLLQKKELSDLYSLQSEFSKERINEFSFSERVKEIWPRNIILYLIDEIELIDDNHIFAKITIHEDEQKTIKISGRSFILVRENDFWAFLAPLDESVKEIYFDQRKELKKIIDRFK